MTDENKLFNSSNVNVPGRWVFRVDGGPEEGNVTFQYKNITLFEKLLLWHDVVALQYNMEKCVILTLISSFKSLIMH